MLCVWNIWLSQPQPRGGASSRVLSLQAAAFLVGAARQPVTGKRSPESANGQPGSVASPPPAVPVGPPLQSDRPPTSGPIWTGTPDGPQTSTDIINRCEDVDLTNVNTFDFSFSVLDTVNATVDVTATDSATVDATATTSCSTPFLSSFSRFFDVSMLNMLPHAIPEGMAPNIQVTIHSVVVHMLLDSGA